MYALITDDKQPPIRKTNKITVDDQNFPNFYRHHHLKKKRNLLVKMFFDVSEQNFDEFIKKFFKIFDKKRDL